MGATSKTCLLFITIQIINVITAQEMAKRVPQGFLGMRGKKYLDYDEPDRYYKRKPQFFVGVKGKKNVIDYLEESQPYFYKRAPMGFMGMRGKKDATFTEPTWDMHDSYEYVPKRDGSLIGQIDYSANNDFNELHQKDFPLLHELLMAYIEKEHQQSLQKEMGGTEKDSNEELNELITNEVEKRAANIHQFFGVRGKKSVQSKRPFDLTFRGKFIGVRGKKDLKNSDAHEIKFLLDQNGPWPKRKGPMGFVGMRGKKWNDDLISEMETID